MKRSLLFSAICATVLTVATFVACNSNEPQINGNNFDQDESYTELMQDLDAFHANYMKNRSVDQSRSLKRFFRKLFSCVKADCFALTIKNNQVTVTFSPLASYAAWCNGYSVATKDEYDGYVAKLIQNEKLLYQMCDAVSFQDNNMGDIHNKILIELFKRCTPQDSYTKIVLTAAQVSREIGVSMGSLAEIRATSNELTHFMNSIFDVSDEVMAQRLKKYCPQKTKDIDVVMNYFANIQNLSSVEEIQAYTAQYKAVIDASKISKIEKEDLASTIDVAPASMKLWSTIITEE